MKFAFAFAAAALLAGPALAAGDAAEGEKVFKKCAACHKVGEGAKNITGPALNGVVGRVKGSSPDFKYSDVYVKAKEAGDKWTPEALNAYLENPKDAMPGNKMSFAGLKKPEERENVIFYLAGFGADGKAQDAAKALEAAGKK